MYNLITTQMVANFLEVKVSRIREWINGDYLGVEDPANGQGKLNRFSKDDLLKFMIFRDLVDFGLSRTHSKRILDSINVKKTGEYVIRLEVPISDYRKRIEEKF